MLRLEVQRDQLLDQQLGDHAGCALPVRALAAGQAALAMTRKLALIAVVALEAAACSSTSERGSEHSGSTSLAPAVTGTNSSTATQGPPGSGAAPNPPTAEATPPK